MQQGLYYLHGVGNQDHRMQAFHEIDMAGKVINDREPIDFALLTEGEAYLRIIDRRLSILAQTRPGAAQNIEVARNYIYRSLAHGLHESGSIPNIHLPRGLEDIQRSVKKAKANGRSAINGPNPCGWRDKNLPFYPDDPQRFWFETIEDRLGIKYKINKKLANRFRGETNPEAIKIVEKCQYQAIIADRMEASGYSLMYEYADNFNAYATVAAKRVLQSRIISGLSSISGISRNNVSLMTENGILANGIRQSGLVTYQTLRDGSTIPGINDPVTIITAITAGIIALTKLADTVINPKDTIEAGFNPGFETAIRAEQNDFSGGAGGGSGTSSGLSTTQIGLGLLALWGGSQLLSNNSQK